MNPEQYPQPLSGLNKSSISAEIDNDPKISVIICAYTTDRLKDIHEAVNSVQAQTLEPGEVIIAVDHNEELYQELTETYGDSANLNESQPIPIKLVLNTSTYGLSETRNVGIRAATGDIVAFIDDDAVAENDWLENLVKPFLSQPEPETNRGSTNLLTSANLSKSQRKVVAVGGRAIPRWHNGRRPSWFPEELDWIVGCTYKGLPLKGEEIRNVPGDNMAFGKEIFYTVGFFRSELGRTGKTKGVAEEPELCLRIKQGMPDSLILHKPEAIIHHKIPSWRLSLEYLIQRSYDEGLCKSLVKSLSSTSFSKSLSTESSYLRYLLLKSMPERLKHFYKRDSLSQAGVIMLSIAATGLGYLVGELEGPIYRLQMSTKQVNRTKQEAFSLGRAADPEAEL